MSFSYREFPPSPRFRAHIECFWWHESGAAIPSYRVLPDGCVDILFQRKGNESGALRVVGTMTRAHRFELPARQIALGVRFRPAMAARFLRVGATEIVDRAIDLGDFWSSRRTRFLAGRIAEAETPEEGAAQIEAALGEAPALDAPEKAIAQLVDSRGIVNLDDLADAARLSPRHFRRVCLERTGISPKRLTRILRFRIAVTRATPERQGDWAGVALECGYYDQAHLINEFREFSGVAPGNFCNDLIPRAAQQPE
jgi:AraC-like DNA-binding protein